ncbi:MAG: protein kinase domain-containing protein, partial [Burkholderiaceae bacterium]
MKANFELDPVQWSRLRGLLDEALALAPAERANWVERLGTPDEDLKPRLRALLAHAAGDSSPLDTLPHVETAQFLAERARRGDAALAPGAAVGPYRLIRLLGEGGMGQVWLAERSDMLHKRPVALKLPRLFVGRAQLAERLAREREILATLEHPNIARLYDAGLTAEGQPYLALEYVEGERIDGYCVRKALDVAARLRLFLQVARAVAHAHARLVVHRDLKPANILVTEAGEVRLLDFGIAKLLEDGRAQETELTQLAGRALTPDYAAPEQVLGQPIGTAADVYVLGVLLFELLTGQRPYKLKRDSRAALEEAIAQAEVERPSSVVADAKLKRRLRGDLDTIVLKALKRLPAERYGTVEAFAEDIERHLDQRPVRAQPDSASYRARKFVARNAPAVGASVAVLLAVLTGATVALWQARLAVAEKQRAEAVKDFIASMFREVDPFAVESEKPVTAADLLGHAQQRVDREPGMDPATRAELLTVVGASLAGLGEYQRAADVLAQAVETWRTAASADDPRALRAQLQWADAEHKLGRTEAARECLARVAALLEGSGRTDSEEFVRAKITEATFEFSEGRFTSERAFAAAQTAVRVAERVLGQRNDQTITAYHTLAAAHRWRNELAQAARYGEVAYRAALVHFGDDGRHPRTIQIENEYGRALAGVGRLGEAVAHMKSAAQRAADAYGARHVMVQHFKGTLAAVQLDYGEIQEALCNLTEALAQDVGSARLSPTYRASQSIAYARALLAARRASEAIGHYEAALALLDHAGAHNPSALSSAAE